ncbi:ABC transporter permease [Limobrevibacterium gyesilva]|nr:FtsX-like permease family protein [Limobrevibacterium gyesilva]
MLALRLARRELRGGVRGLRIVLACLALGVAAIAAVGTLREGVARGLAADGSRILGGDIEVQGGSQPLPETLRAWLRARGARISDVVTMRSMLVAPSGERMLVELKAVDDAWPLVGTAAFDPPQALAQTLGGQGIAVEGLVMDRLGVRPGDTLRLGHLPMQLRGTATAEPDRVATPSIFGPRALIALADLPATGLEQPGAILEHRLRAVLPAGADTGRMIRDLRAAFPEQGWRLREARNAAPAVARFIDRTSLFMTLVGLTALLVGGIGVANGTRAWLEARHRSIATLRCLGASGRLVFAVALIQVMALSALGVLAGLAVGAALPALASRFLRDVLPVPPVPGVFPAPLALAAAYGLLTAATFALWPLARTMRIPGAALFRDPLVPARVRLRGPLLAANAVLGAGLVGLTVAAADDRGFALWFCAAAAGTLGLFRAGGWAMTALAARAPHAGRPWARLGLSNLHRPGNATPLMLVSLGLGLSTLAAVALIQGNLRRQVLEQLPERAPSFFFIDIQNDQMDRFRQVLTEQPGVQEVQEVPSLRARVVAVNGVPADRVRATPDTTWALRGDRGLTYAARPPEGTRLVAGQWWPADYAGPPLVSFDANLAKGWGVHLGDTIRVNVLGRDIDLRVASLRDIAWRTLGINFTLIASPGLLERAPHTHIATVRVDPASQGAVLRAVTDALPNVSGIRVEDVLRTVSDLLGQIGAALAATGSLTLAAGALVLAGAVAAGQSGRIRQAVILKSLGATRAQIRAAWLVEFGLLGACAGLIAAAVGTAASYGVVHFVMGTDWAFLPGTLAATVLSCIVLMLVFGYAGTAAALRAKAAPLLRNE